MLLELGRSVRIERRQGYFVVHASGGRCNCGDVAVAVLGAFARPTSVAAAVAALGRDLPSKQAWLALTSAVVSLVRIGALVPAEGSPGRAADLVPTGFAAASAHVRMLDDHQRTQAFIAAIQSSVRNGATVVDIGTGTGVLAIAAVRAGASKVYAIEASGMAPTAARLIAANGASDRVRLIEGWSTEIELPERVDLVVGELIGNDPFDERIVESFSDAVERFAKPSALLVPGEIDVFAQLVAVPGEQLELRTCTGANTARWQRSYGIDFSELAQARSPQHFLASPRDVARWRSVSERTLLGTVVLRTQRNADLQLESVLVGTAAGTANGVVISADIKLTPTVRLSTASTEPTNNWKSSVHLIRECVPVTDGCPVTVTFERLGGSSNVLARKS